MRRRVKVVWSLALMCCGFGLLSGCSLAPEPGAYPQPSMATGQNAVAVEGQEKGRGYFLRECGSCHRHFWPQERSVAEWQNILKRKKNKVSLTAAQFKQLSDYVIQGSTRAAEQP